MVPKKGVLGDGDEPAAAPACWSVFRAAVDEILSSRSGACRGGFAFATRPREGGSFGARLADGAPIIDDGGEQLGIRVRHGGSAASGLGRLAPRERAGNVNPIASTELVASGFSL